MRKKKYVDPFAPFFRYLNRLRAGGRTNMYGAIPYLAAEFRIEREAAFQIVCRWIDAQAELADQQPAGDVRTRLPEQLRSGPSAASTPLVEQMSIHFAMPMPAVDPESLEPRVVYQPKRPGRKRTVPKPAMQKPAAGDTRAPKRRAAAPPAKPAPKGRTKAQPAVTPKKKAKPKTATKPAAKKKATARAKSEAKPARPSRKAA